MTRIVHSALVAGAFVIATQSHEPGSAAAAGQTGLTGGAELSRIYDAIYDARFGLAENLLNQACPRPGVGDRRLEPPRPPHETVPREACLVLEAVSRWWQIRLDPDNTGPDQAFRAQADAAIAASGAWTRREPARAEAWFYLGGAYGARVQWQSLRGERLAAARDGKRIKEALERAIGLDAELQDAYFGIGLYHYYADVAPAVLRVLRWLFLLPGGNRVQGLQEMLRARGAGQLLRSEADYQLHQIYLWYENQPQRAVELLTDLRERHPSNPHFVEAIADIQERWLHDPSASLDTYRDLLALAASRQVAESAMAEAVAHLGMARQLDQLFQTDVALDHARAVIERRPASPFGAVAEAHLQLGRSLDRLGQRPAAQASYRAAIAAAPTGDPRKVADRARAGIRSAPKPTDTTAYRLSLEGWRALERGAIEDADDLITRALRLVPDDPITQYRYARLLLAEKRADAALVVFASLHRRRHDMPPFVFALACLDAARVHEQRGTLDVAAALYATASTVIGADARTKTDAQRALERLAPRSGHSAR